MIIGKINVERLYRRLLCYDYYLLAPLLVFPLANRISIFFEIGEVHVLASEYRHIRLAGRGEDYQLDVPVTWKRAITPRYKKPGQYKDVSSNDQGILPAHR